jgi:adenine-specific DNA-methyltransferase
MLKWNRTCVHGGFLVSLQRIQSGSNSQMAKLEDLIKQIPDTRLREELAREAAALKSTKKFGLVFEEHIPEQVQLPGLPVRTGSRVVSRGNGKQVFQVVDTKGKTAHLIPEPEGQEETAGFDELVVIKRFGEPIYPTLTPGARIERAPDKPWHTIINADNFHALQLLLYCYEGMVDVIYIDPPYNTGARDWKYNNDYVDRNDQFRHLSNPPPEREK